MITTHSSPSVDVLQEIPSADEVEEFKAQSTINDSSTGRVFSLFINSNSLLIVITVANTLVLIVSNTWVHEFIGNLTKNS